MKSMKYAGMAGAIITLGLALSACSLSTPSQLEADRMQVRESHAAMTLDRHAINEETLSRVADDYRQNSSGMMNVYIAYPAGLPGAETEANRLARQYGVTLADKGVDRLTVAVVPTADSAYERRVVVSYPRYKAEPPQDCARLTGTYGAENVYDIRDYEMGCETMRYTSRMISDPTDLLGKSGTRDADSRRAGNIVERYRTGEEFEPLDVSGASEVGG